MDRGAWRATVHGVAKESDMTECLNDNKKNNLFIQQKVSSESEIAQLCLTLCDAMDYSLPSFSVHGVFQARILEWVAISFSRGLQADALPSEPPSLKTVISFFFLLLITFSVQFSHSVVSDSL